VVELQKRRAAELVRSLSCFNEAIILCDFTNSQDWRVLYANDAWGTLTGRLLAWLQRGRFLLT
jgi:hypothetical protein